MVLRILGLARHSGWAALVAASAAAVACSSNQTPVPQAFVAATVGVGPQSSSSVCNFGSPQPWLDVGVAVTGNTPVTQADNSNSNGQVSVACTVSASGSGFDIDLVVSQGGLQGGSVTITSPPGMGAVTTAGASGITGVFESETYGEYRETDCTISFTYNGEMISNITTQPTVAAGRIWGHLSCPTAQIQGQTVMVDGGTQNKQCDAEADFLFEQCSL
jgi:hypothetical protein